MKKLFTEPEIEILSFLCNEDIEGSDEVDLGGNGEDGGEILG